MIPAWIIIIVLLGLPLAYAIGIATGYQLITGHRLGRLNKD